MDILKSVINKAMENHQVKITIGAESKKQDNSVVGSKFHYKTFAFGVLLGACMVFAGFMINWDVSTVHNGIQSMQQKPQDSGKNASKTASGQQSSNQKIDNVLGAGAVTTVFGLIGRL